MTTVGVIALGRPTFDVALGGTRFREARQLLAALDEIHVTGPTEVFTDTDAAVESLRELTTTKLHAVVVVFATFADNRFVQELDDLTDTPVLLWSVPEPRRGEQLAMNSLCGSHLSAFELHRRGHRYTTVHVDPSSDDAGRAVACALADVAAGPTAANRVVAASDRDDADRSERPSLPPAEAIDVARDLVGATIGQVGAPPPGFTPCEGDDVVLATTTGMHVDHIEIEDLFDVADGVDDELLDGCRLELDATGTRRPGIPALEGERSLRLRAALVRLIEDRSWDAVAVRCWPECLDVYGAAICTPLAFTTWAGVPAVCEADLLGAATGLLLRRVSGGDPFVTDVVDAESDSDTMAIWHCGSASPSWAATPVEVTGHPIKHVALANQFALRAGPVTVARLSRSDGDDLSLWTGTAELLDRARPFTGTSGVLRWPTPVSGVRRRLLAAGVEHHLAVVPGSHADLLDGVAEVWRIDRHAIARREPALA